MEQQKVFTVQKEPGRTDRIYMKKSRHVLVTDQQLRECAGFLGLPTIPKSFLTGFQGSEEIFDQILRVFDPDGDTHRVLKDTGVRLLPVRVF